MIKIATVHGAVSANVRHNGHHVRASMVGAARAGARLVHFAEGALSGYIRSEIDDWPEVDWTALQEELDLTAALAKSLGIWVVVGANHRLRPPRWPQNSLYVISDAGMLAGRYSKRMCSNTEVTYWYTPGVDPLVFDVDGVRFGCALCIEVVFPQLFAEYERLGVTCLLLSSYSNDPMHGVMARAHAATNCMWLSVATPTTCPDLPSMLIGPDGHVLGACAGTAPGLLIQTIDPADPKYRVALRLARPWRARATSGEIYAGRHARAT